MGVYLLKVFGISLLLTLLLEWIFALAWGLRGKKVFLLVTLVNIVTNPAAVLTYWLYGIFIGKALAAVQICIEIVVVTAEALIYRSFAQEESFGLKRPVWFAVLANGLSWGIVFWCKKGGLL